MIICFIALGLRGLSFGFTYDPYLLAATQVLDGVSASILGILVPLIAADATMKRGGFAMAQGFLGTTMSLGAALSTTLAGFLSDSYGSQNAFLVLASIALVGVLAVFVFMPETKLPSE
jgi:MFS family permease